MEPTIQERVNREKNAYDFGSVLENSSRLQSRFSHVFLCPNTLAAERYLDETVKSVAGVPDSTVLDYGCNSGWYSKNLKDWGFRNVYGIDISSKAIGEAKERFGDIGVFDVADAHRTSFPDDRFDLVVGRSILHHLDYEVALREIRRILKPGGKAVFMEPLRDNPGAKLMRLLTPKFRTPDELPLSRGQIEWADGVLGANHHYFFGLVSVAVGMLSSLVSRNPNNAFLRLAHRVDLFLAKTPVKYWMRQVVLVWEKR